MRYSELAARYASAIFDVAQEKGHAEKVFTDLRALNELFTNDRELDGFVHSPLISAADKEKSVSAAINSAGLSEEVASFVLLLARKGRLRIFDQIVQAYIAKSDEANGVTRGTVHSTTKLGPEERNEIERFVSEATKKKVILSYDEDPQLIGGVVAQVGSYTFDDSLSSHLRRLTDHINRRAH